MGVLVAVGTSVSVLVGVDEGVAVSPLCVSTTSCGAFAPDSRLARLEAVALVVVRARLKKLLPVIKEVTSTDVHVPPLNAPDAPRNDPTAGALL